MSEQELRAGPQLSRRAVLKAAALGASGDRRFGLPGRLWSQDVEPRRGQLGRLGRRERRGERCAERGPIGRRGNPVQDRLRQPADRPGGRLRRARPVHHRPGSGQAEPGLPGGWQELRDHDRPEGRPVRPGEGSPGRQRPDHDRQGRPDPRDLDAREQQPDRRRGRGRGGAVYRHGRAVGGVRLPAPEGPGETRALQVHLHLLLRRGAVRQDLHLDVGRHPDQQEGRRHVAERRRRQRHPQAPSARNSRRPATRSSTRAPTRTGPTTTRRRSRSSSRRTARSSTPSRSRPTSRHSGSRPPSRATFRRSRRSRRPDCSRRRSRPSAT